MFIRFKFYTNIMNATHQIITNYIDEAVAKAVGQAATKAAREAADEVKKSFKEMFKKYKDEDHKEYLRHMADLKGYFSESLKGMVEIEKAKPDEERVREIIQEENKPLKTEIDIIKKHVALINKRV
jgi:flagellar motor component MotA